MVIGVNSDSEAFGLVDKYALDSLTYRYTKSSTRVLILSDKAIVNTELIDMPAVLSTLQKYDLDWIEFRYTNCYRVLVVEATVKPTPVVLLPVRRTGNSNDAAFDAAIRLLQRIKDLAKQGMPIAPPALDKQTFEHGYYREMLTEELEVEFQRHGNGYVISGINRKDSQGFYFVEQPFPVPKNGKWTRDLGGFSDGSELYCWDDLNFLSGSRGLAVVQNGLVIKTKTTAMA